jgi:DNA-binding phage protein
VKEEVSSKKAKLSRTNVRGLARGALLQLFEPLSEFAIDVGLSTSDLYSIIRQAAVRRVAAHQLEVSRRVNISGIAATTGIPRSEISRILKTAANKNVKSLDAPQQSTNRILAAWHEEPKFTTPNGEPADLKIYGRGPTFDLLVKRHGRGIPTRAILDELVRAHAVELLSSQRVRARTPLAVPSGISPQMIRAFGERATELIDTLVSNMKSPDNPKFVASISGSTAASRGLPLFRRELSSKGAGFLTDVKESLSQRISKNRSSGSNKVSVTVFYHESDLTKMSKSPNSRRRNLRRRP